MKKKGLLALVCELNSNGDQFIPYDEYLYNGHTWMELSKANCLAMVNEFNRPNNTTDKRPWYIGHPDQAGSDGKYKPDRKYTDFAAKGYIIDLVCEANGLRVVMDWTPKGRQILDDREFAYWSPFMWGVATGRRKEGKPVAKPTIFRSAGFTHEPVMPLPLACEESEFEEETQTQENTMNLFQKLLARFKLPDTTTETELTAKVEEQLELACKLQNKLDSANAAKAAAETAKTEAETAKETAKAQTALVCETLKHAHLNSGKQLLVLACEEGRLVPADEAPFESRLATTDPAAFALVCEEIKALPKKVKTEPESKDDGTREAQGAATHAERQAFICEEQERFKKAGHGAAKAYDLAYAAAENKFK